ncbi:MAG: FAD:protein FMN transferase [Verrucomicrobia bacterium]|nr:FAD:protein FMN transferase [Verrucomicrobiota bacterium]
MATSPALFRFVHEAMNTQFEILLPETDADQTYAAQAAHAVFDELDRLEDELSRYRSQSDIFRINHLKKGGSTIVGLAALDCLSIAQAVHRETDGAFDISVGPLMNIYRDAGGGLRIPHSDEETWARARVGMNRFDLDAEEHMVTVHADEIVLDLGAIGKGYALDQCADLLGDWSIKNALLNAGDSTVLGLGAAADSDGWTVTAGNKGQREILLKNNALSGSGFHVKGAHIINPRTMRPVPPKPDRTWCIAPTAALSDALSTAFMVMKPEEIEILCGRNEGVVAILD